jgi:septum formation inhibitor MinC
MESTKQTPLITTDNINNDEIKRLNRLQKKREMKEARRKEESELKTKMKQKKDQGTSDEEIVNLNKKDEDDLKNEDLIQNLPEDQLKDYNQIYTACFKNDSVELVQLLNEWKCHHIDIPIELLLKKRLNKDKGFTLLHLVCELGNAECVQVLLEAGADPCLQDYTKTKRVPYTVASTKRTRDHFRLFMNDNPDRYNWKLAQVNDALTKQQMEEKALKEKEKKKQQKQAKKERESKMKEAERKAKLEEEEKMKFLKMNDEQKRKDIMDKRALFYNKFQSNGASTAPSTSTLVNAANSTIKNLNRCRNCGNDLASIEPFEYYDFKFCSSKCLRIHRASDINSNYSNLNLKK